MALVEPYQMSIFESEFRDNKFPKTQYLGSKEHLVRWIFNHSPNNITTFLDAFSGTSVVSYYFKSKNKQVITNDFLKFNYHIGKSLIENKNIKLEAKDLELLLSENKNSETFIEDVFSGIFFERDQARFLDNFRANVNLLDNEYKISLAFAIMNRALTRKVLLGHFAHLSALRYSKDPNRVKRNPTIARPLKDLFLELVPEYNNAIFDNGYENTAFCEDAIVLISKLDNIDLVYFDPPYRPISKTASFKAYHKQNFTDSEQLQLAQLFKQLDSEGSYVMLSNSDPKNIDPDDNFFDDMYNGFNIVRVPARRMINSDPTKRGRINEIVVTNYTTT